MYSSLTPEHQRICAAAASVVRADSALGQGSGSVLGALGAFQNEALVFDRMASHAVTLAAAGRAVTVTAIVFLEAAVDRALRECPR
jgi:hypothetical protein